MKNRSILEKLGDFVLGKGFYIVLFLCVATIGISGYYLIHNMTDRVAEPAGGDAVVVLPDSEANGPEPVGTVPSTQSNLGQEIEESANAAVKPEKQKDDPLPEKQPIQQEEPKEQKSAAVYTWPVEGEILRDFSVETLALDPTLGDWRTHGGLDIAAALGAEVRAMAAGTVAQVNEDGLMGVTVVVDHGDGLVTKYCGLAAQPPVEAGDTVASGDVIGSVGDTAIAESGLASHLHLEAGLNGERVDPMEYLP